MTCAKPGGQILRSVQNDDYSGSNCQRSCAIVPIRDEFVHVGENGETYERRRGILVTANPLDRPSNWPLSKSTKKFAWRDQFLAALVGEDLV